MIATLAMVRKLILFLLSLRYWMSVEFAVNPGIGKHTSAGYRHVVVFRIGRRAEAGERILAAWWLNVLERFFDEHPAIGA